MKKRRVAVFKVPSRHEREGFAFVLPCLLMLFLILGFPMIIAILNSFTPLWSEVKTFTLDNYVKLAKDKLFWNALSITFRFVASTVLLHLLVGLAVALALNAQIRANRFFRVIAILPWTVPDVISGLIWRFMYNPTSGIINHFLRELGLTKSYIEWLAQPHLALPSVIFADVWRGYPFVMIILLAGLQAIPRELYEAARVDGASSLQEFRHITIPLLRRMIIIALALDTIWQFRRFGLIYNMTLGGPGHVTEILSLYVYKQYFKYFNFEYASAMAVVMA
ncbi:MAG: sugar ABC transporter permease, partial [Anaerolineae bacterium]|nr:sugar ABC transporter permease [Anaerolineae bacterium]